MKIKQKPYMDIRLLAVLLLSVAGCSQEAVSTDAASLTPSEPVTVTTTVPDTSAPVIVKGPEVAPSENSVTVVWQTSEPAASVVSVDGDAFNTVIREENPVTMHEVTITGLQSYTQYSYTTSSTDEAGNGPTMSDTASFFTLPSGGY